MPVKLKKGGGKSADNVIDERITPEMNVALAKNIIPSSAIIFP